MSKFEDVKAVVVEQLSVDANEVKPESRFMEKIKTVNDVVAYIEKATK